MAQKNTVTPNRSLFGSGKAYVDEEAAIMRQFESSPDILDPTSSPRLTREDFICLLSQAEFYLVNDDGEGDGKKPVPWQADSTDKMRGIIRMKLEPHDTQGLRSKWRVMVALTMYHVQNMKGGRT